MRDRIGVVFFNTVLFVILERNVFKFEYRFSFFWFDCLIFCLILGFI